MGLPGTPLDAARPVAHLRAVYIRVSHMRHASANAASRRPPKRRLMKDSTRDTLTAEHRDRDRAEVPADAAPELVLAPVPSGASCHAGGVGAASPGCEATPGAVEKTRINPGRRLKACGSSHALPGCGFMITRPFPGCALSATRGYQLPSLRDAITAESWGLPAQAFTQGRAKVVVRLFRTLHPNPVLAGLTPPSCIRAAAQPPRSFASACRICDTPLQMPPPTSVRMRSRNTFDYVPRSVVHYGE